MPKPFPVECRGDGVAVAPHGGSLARIAQDFGITEPCLRNWLGQADVENRVRPGVTPSEAAPVRELKRRNHQLEQ